MNIFKLLIPKKSIKRKIIDIEEDVKIEIKSVFKERFWINRYGAYKIDPKYLVLWICVETDEQKLKLKSNKILKSKWNNILIKNNYPESARPFVCFDFESQETVERESNGNWFEHFK
jgi:hypothetical protein